MCDSRQHLFEGGVIPLASLWILMTQLAIYQCSIEATYLWYKDKCQDNCSERQEEPRKDSCIYINEVIQCDGTNYHDCDNHWGDVDDQCNELWVVEHFHFHFSCTECQEDGHNLCEEDVSIRNDDPYKTISAFTLLHKILHQNFFILSIKMKIYKSNKRTPVP